MTKKKVDAVKSKALTVDFQPLREKLSSLPVYRIIESVVKDVCAGLVTIVAAKTGSGKSMMLPGALADVSDHQIVVLVPRRFLAIDATFNVAELANIKAGDKVGYALGQMGGESSLHSQDTKVLYCTYGYAISSGLINEAKTIVLDEVHEADEQISLARAILRKRKAAEPKLRILEMSATVDAKTQAHYWHPIAKTAIHSIEDQAMVCEVIEESTVGGESRSGEAIVMDLLTQGRKGVALFRPGVREVEDSVAEIKQMLAFSGVSDVEVVGIHGGTPADERRIARRAPVAGKRKIIVGTNVIESGVNLRWLDAGVSDGFRKVPYHRDDTGADALVLEDLPQSGVLQQIGRINRDPAFTGFESGLFILHSRRQFDMRSLQNGPAIQRQSLNDIAFHAASLGYDPTRLTWDVAGAAHIAALKPRLEQAKQELMLLHLLNDDWSLTEEGKFIKHLPVSPETGAMLVEAKKIDEQRMRRRGKTSPRVVRDIVIIAALVESHGLRDDKRFGHKGDQYHTSDLLDAMNAFRAIRKELVAQAVLDATEVYVAEASDEQLSLLKKQRSELKALCLQYNVSLAGFIEVAHLADEITNRLGQRGAGIRVDARDKDDVYDAERYGELQRCILNANANHLFIGDDNGLRDLLRDYDDQRNFHCQPFNGYEISRTSIVRNVGCALVVGNLREVQDDRILPMNVLTNVTMIPPDVMLAWAAARAADYQPVLSDCSLRGGALSAAYAGKANFEMYISPKMRAEASQLVDEWPSRNDDNTKFKAASTSNL